MNLLPLFTSFFIISAAELGDKTQLLTLGLAAKYNPIKVITAVSLASGILMAIAVVFGGTVNRFIPEFYLQMIAGVLFIGFGFWTLFGKDECDKCKEKVVLDNGKKNGFLIVFSTFFIAELGDKTQLATLTLAAQYGSPFKVWLGATLAMISVNLLALIIGIYLKKFIPEEKIKIFGGIIFLIFGIITL